MIGPFFFLKPFFPAAAVIVQKNQQRLTAATDREKSRPFSSITLHPAIHP
jgi:hypothetical protein